MSAQPPAASGTAQSGLALVRAGHLRVSQHLRDYALLSASTTAGAADRRSLITRIGAQLQTLIALKEDFVYPPLEPRVGSALIAGLRSDHRRIERCLQALAAGVGDDVATDLQMSRLAKVVRAHIALEEERLFPRAGEIDSAQLAQAMNLRRAALLGDRGAA